MSCLDMSLEPLLNRPRPQNQLFFCLLLGQVDGSLRSNQLKLAFLQLLQVLMQDSELLSVAPHAVEHNEHKSFTLIEVQEGNCLPLASVCSFVKQWAS